MNENEVRELLARYTWAHDNRDFEALAECFTADAHYTMRIATNEASQPTIGAKAISDLVASFKAKQTDQRRHLITNVVFDDLTEDMARTRSYVTVLATEKDTLEVVSTGVCADEIVRDSGKLRFRSKAMHLDKGF